MEDPTLTTGLPDPPCHCTGEWEWAAFPPWVLRWAMHNRSMAPLSLWVRNTQGKAAGMRGDSPFPWNFHESQKGGSCFYSDLSGTHITIWKGNASDEVAAGRGKHTKIVKYTWLENWTLGHQCPPSPSCMCYFLQCHGKIPDESRLRMRGHVLAHNSKVQVTLSRQCYVAASRHTASAVRMYTVNYHSAYSLPFFLLFIQGL